MISEALLRDTVAITAHSGHDAYGLQYSDVAITARAYCEPGYRLVRTADGEDVIANLFAILPADTVIAPMDRVLWNGDTYRVIDVQAQRPGGVTHHLEVSLQSV